MTTKRSPYTRRARPNPAITQPAAGLRCPDCGESYTQPHILGPHIPGCSREAAEAAALTHYGRTRP